MKYIFLIAATFIISSTAFAQPGYDAQRVLGMLSSEANPIMVPKTIKANTEFDVTIATGGNGCVEQGDTSVILSDRSADIFVYDVTRAIRPGTICTMIYKEFRHTAVLRFTKKGRAVIRIWVRKQSGRSPMGIPVLIEKRVVVR